MNRSTCVGSCRALHHILLKYRWIYFIFIIIGIYVFHIFSKDPILTCQDKINSVFLVSDFKENFSKYGYEVSEIKILSAKKDELGTSVNKVPTYRFYIKFKFDGVINETEAIGNGCGIDDILYLNELRIQKQDLMGK